MQVMTVGYEGMKLPQFIDLLIKANIEKIIDVRELPLSRKKGFSKRSLATELSRQGIEYVHMRALGCPKQIRHDYRADGDWTVYIERFLAHLSHQTEAMDELNRLISNEQCCLLCFEINAFECHRSLVAQRLQAIWQPRLQITHLRIDQTMMPAVALTSLL